MEEEDGISLADTFFAALDVIIRGKWIILGTFFLALTGATYYNSLKPNEYDTSALIQLNSREQSGMADLLGTGMGMGSMWGYANSRIVSNELVVIQNSIAMTRDIRDKLKELDTVPSTGKPIQLIRDAETGEVYPDGKLVDVIRGAFTASEEGRDVDFIRIATTALDPAEAALIANVVSNAYVEATKASSRRTATASRQFLEEQSQRLTTQLTTLEDDLASFVRENPTVQLDQGTQEMVTQLTDLESTRDLLEIEIQGLQSRLSMMEDELSAIQPRLAQRISSGREREIVLAQQRLAELKLQRDEILISNPSLRNAPATPELQQVASDIQFVENRIATLSEQFVQEVLDAGGVMATPQGSGANGQGSSPSADLVYVSELQRGVVMERITLSGKYAQKELLDERIQQYAGRLDVLPNLTYQLAQLERGRQSAEQLFVFMTERLQEARIVEESELGYATVIWEARPPTIPARPNRPRNLILAIFLGIGAGFGIAWLRFSLDKRIYAPDDLKKLNKNLLTVIPDFAPLLREEFDDEEWTKVGDSRISTSLISLTKPFTPISESFRQLRTNIQFARPDKVVQVVAGISATAGEGKTTNATNLAIVMAQADRKTLLIDADLRRPRLHRVFGQNREPGLIDLLFEDERPVDPAAIDWKLKTAQFHEPVDNLHVLTAGRKIPNPSEFFGSKLFRDFIHQMREHYDMIVLDCAPVLVATDTAIIATQCDAVYVIVKSGEIDPSLLEQAETQLKQTGVEPMGYVLNGFDATQAGGYSYRYRYRYYSYGYKYRYGKYNRYYGYGYGYGYYGDKDKAANEKEAKA